MLQDVEDSDTPPPCQNIKYLKKHSVISPTTLKSRYGYKQRRFPVDYSDDDTSSVISSSSDEDFSLRYSRHNSNVKHHTRPSPEKSDNKVSAALDRLSTQIGKALTQLDESPPSPAHAVHTVHSLAPTHRDQLQYVRAPIRPSWLQPSPSSVQHRYVTPSHCW